MHTDENHEKLEQEADWLPANMRGPRGVTNSVSTYVLDICLVELSKNTLQLLKTPSLRYFIMTATEK